MTENVTLKKSMAKESIGQFMQRIKNGGTRKPLRTIQELAEEFEMSAKSLVGLMTNRNGPKPVFRTGGGKSASSRNTYYRPEEVREWFKTINSQGKP